jgi:hypothetical protein
MSTRAEILAGVRATLVRTFPKAQFTTNDDANPATPMTVTASWKAGRIVKVVRADSITSTPDEFIEKATRLLSGFQQANVPARELL